MPLASQEETRRSLTPEAGERLRGTQSTPDRADRGDRDPRRGRRGRRRGRRGGGGQRDGQSQGAVVGGCSAASVTSLRRRTHLPQTARGAPIAIRASLRRGIARGGARTRVRSHATAGSGSRLRRRTPRMMAGSGASTGPRRPGIGGRRRGSAAGRQAIRDLVLRSQASPPPPPSPLPRMEPPSPHGGGQS